MANVALNVSFDTRNFSLWNPYDAYDAFLSASQVTLYWDSTYQDRTVYYGSFLISGEDVASGIITSAEEYLDGVRQYTASNLNYDVSLYKSYATTGNPRGFLADILKNNDTFTGSSGADYMESFAGNDTLDGLAGNDTLVGGTGNDTYLVGSGDQVIELSGEGSDTVNSAISWLLGNNLENLTLTGSYAINATGNSLNNRLTGNAANNVLDGGDGIDTLIGGAGNDTYLVTAGDQVTELSGEGTDKVNSASTWTLSSQLENLTLTGANSINGTGNSLDNILTGNPGNNSLKGLSGNDSLLGGAGNDTAIYAGASKGYRIASLGDGRYTVTDSNVSNGNEGIDTLSDIESLAFTDGTVSLVPGEFRSNTTTLGTQSHPAIMALADGGFLVAWQAYGQGSPGYGVYGQRYDAFGRPVGGETQINTTTVEWQEDPKVAVTSLANGGYLVTWDSLYSGGGKYGIFGQRYNSAGSTVGSETLLNSTMNSQYFHAITALADGGYTLVWMALNRDGDQWGIYSQRYDSSGSAVGGETLVNTTTANSQRLPSITALANGGYVVSWTDDGLDGSEMGIYAQRFNSVGSPVGGETRVNTHTINVQTFSAVTALTDGGYVVTWESWEQDGSGKGVYAQRYNSGGNPVGSETRVNTFTSFDQSTPEISALPDGGYVAVWVSLNQDGDGMGIFGHRFTALGASAGSEFRVSTYATSSQANPAVTALADGGFVVAWQSYGQDGDSNGVYAQRYDSAGNRVAARFTGNATDNTLIWNSADAVIMDGSAGNDSLSGSTANDSLIGGLGNDTLTGNAGNDLLDGNTGNDVLIGGTGNDVYVVNVTTDSVTELAAQGIDLIKTSVTFSLADTDGAGANGDNVENLTLTGSYAISGTGNGLNNTLTGNSGNNTLTDSAGADTLDGGLGKDTMAGGVGNDTYIVDNVGDVVTELASGGADLVQSSIAFSFGIASRAELENLVLTGTAANNGTGNAKANVITGNVAANVLTGGGGNDTLKGGSGSDTLAGRAGLDNLTGGLGADKFKFVKASEGLDTVTDFSTAQGDKLVFVSPNFGGLTPGVLAASVFALNDSGQAGDADDRFIFETDAKLLWYDADGNGAGAAVQIAKLNVSSLANADILVSAS